MVNLTDGQYIYTHTLNPHCVNVYNERNIINQQSLPLKSNFIYKKLRQNLVMANTYTDIPILSCSLDFIEKNAYQVIDQNKLASGTFDR